MRRSIRYVVALALFAAPALAAPPPLVTPAVPMIPDKLLKVGPRGDARPDVGVGGVATTRVHPQLVSADGAGGAYVFDQLPVSLYDNRVVVTHLGSGGVADANFGTGGGMVLGAVGATLLQGATLDAKGRVVLLVSSKPMASPTAALVVYRFAGGRLDPTFGGGGAVTVPVPSPAVALRTGPVAIGRDTSGRIVIAGSDDPNKNRNIFVVRLLENGAIDGSFAGGIALHSNNNNAFDVSRIMVDARYGGIWVIANKAVAGGVIMGAAEPVTASGGIAIFRFNASGTIDTTFGTKGSVLLEETSQGYGALDAVVTPSTQVVVGGYMMPSGGGAASLKPVLIRWDENGHLDSGFGSGGKVILSGVGGTVGRVRRVTTDGSGRIVAVGSYRTAGSNGRDAPVTFVSRFDNSGTADPTFGTAGTASFNVQSLEPEIDAQGNAFFRGP